MIFQDRADAGRQLAAKLLSYGGSDTRIEALPRGGVPVAFEVAKQLRTPLDVFVVRKLGVPGHEELAMGAIASGNVRVLNDETIDLLGIDSQTIEDVTEMERHELARREKAYRGNLPAKNITGKTVILVDDGLATGSSMYAAILAVRASAPKRVIVAVPVAPPDTVQTLAREVDDMVVLSLPEAFRGVGAWYGDFSQISDEDVRDLLRRSAQFVEPSNAGT